jgi:mRNA-degrading endonuclease RelE of RelBE toxin-antitoxin system
VNLYELTFLESAENEFLALRSKEQRLFSEKLVYLLRNPFRSYPWLRPRQGARHPEEWKFHLGEFRVFYRVDGLEVVITRLAPRPTAYPKRPPKSGRRTR